MRTKILDILRQIREDVDFENEKELLTGEVLDSFDIISLISLLEEKLKIDIDLDDITDENFNSLDCMCEYLESNEGK